MYRSASYNEQWSPDEMIEEEEIDSPEYYDLYDDLKGRLCEKNKEPGEDKVCCPEDEIKVGLSSDNNNHVIINNDNII